MHQIRKTSVAIKGGPGGVGIYYDKDDKQVKTHDGSVERVVENRVAGLVNKTAAFTVSLPEDNGKIFELDALAGIEVTLPALSAANKGMRVTFVNGLLPTSNHYGLNPASGDAIGYGSDSADLDNTAGTDALGDLITLESDGVDRWLIINKIGTWA